MSDAVAFAGLGLLGLMVAILFVMPYVPRGSIGAKILIGFFILLGIGSPIFAVLIVFGSAQSIENLVQLL